MINNFFPKKTFTLEYAAIGNPIKHEISNADNETLRERNTISDSSVLKLKISLMEFVNISLKSDKNTNYQFFK